MAEFRFHHCERRRVDQALPALLEGLLAEGRRIVVRAPSREMADALNDRLWTYDDASFLPHGGAGDGDPASQPIFLTDGIESPNGATVLVLLAGAETAPGDAAFAAAIRLFDGRDEAGARRGATGMEAPQGRGRGAKLLARGRRRRLGAGALTGESGGAVVPLFLRHILGCPSIARL